MVSFKLRFVRVYSENVYPISNVSCYGEHILYKNCNRNLLAILGFCGIVYELHAAGDISNLLSPQPTP